MRPPQPSVHRATFFCIFSCCVCRLVTTGVFSRFGTTGQDRPILKLPSSPLAMLVSEQRPGMGTLGPESQGLCNECVSEG